MFQIRVLLIVVLLFFSMLKIRVLLIVVLLFFSMLKIRVLLILVLCLYPGAAHCGTVQLLFFSTLKLRVLLKAAAVVLFIVVPLFFNRFQYLFIVVLLIFTVF